MDTTSLKGFYRLGSDIGKNSCSPYALPGMLEGTSRVETDLDGGTSTRFDGRTKFRCAADDIKYDEPITVTGWVRINAANEQRTLYSRGTSVQCGWTDKQQLVSMIGLDEQTLWRVQGQKRWKVGEWVWLGYVYRPFVDCSLYLNGKLDVVKEVPENSRSLPQVDLTNDDIAIGCYRNAQYPRANMKDVAVYGEAKDEAWFASEFASLSNPGVKHEE